MLVSLLDDYGLMILVMCSTILDDTSITLLHHTGITV